ncbi:hypothetical protein JW911_01240 [Candidatus Peregrinibacteria bacterium]|nr:hypothetical protein [Candidatus Peregrinibacteria bacterium]
MTTIEKLTKRDAEKISRETIIAWYRARRMEKFQDLKEIIKSSSYAERTALRAKIVENTRLELQKHQHLTEAERRRHAEEFADSVFKAAEGRTSIESVIKKHEGLYNQANKESLFKNWKENNPNKKHEILEDDPKYLALRYISEPKARAEVCMLLHMVDKFMGGRKKALEIYHACMKASSFDMKQFRSYFSRQKTEGRLGFWYGTRVIKFKPKQGILAKLKAASAFNSWLNDNWEILEGNIWSGYHKTIKTTGWWAHDIDDKDSKGSVIGGSQVTITSKDVVKQLRGAGAYGDEWLGKNLVDAIPYIKQELKGTSQSVKIGERDSGLDAGAEQKILEAIEETKDLSNKVYKEKTSEEMFKWFAANAVNKWVQLNDKENGLMVFLYGQGCGNYLYRYEPKQKKIYMVPIQGAKTEAKYYGGYIEIKNNRLDDTWNGLNEANMDKMLKALIDTMSSAEMNAEAMDYKLKTEKPEAIPETHKAARTMGMVASLIRSGKSGIPKNVEYKNLQTGYIDVVQEKLKRALMQRGLKDETANELAMIRAYDLKKKILAKIEGDEDLKKALEENDKEKIEIIVEHNDDVDVKIVNTGFLTSLRDKRRKAREAAEKAKTSPDRLREEAMDKLEAKVRKYAGPATPLVMFILRVFFKADKKVKDFFTGKAGPFFGAIFGALGLKKIKEKIGSRHIKARDLDKLPPKGKSSYTFKKKTTFESDVTLKNKKIIIPKGKGFIPGGKIKIMLNNSYEVECNPAKKDQILSKGKFNAKSFFRIFDRDKAQYMYRDNEIVIADGTRIPKSTVIPAGAKIQTI